MVTNVDVEQITGNNDAANSRKAWQVVRFEQMAECITDRVDDPSKANVEYYVGLEHLDSESLKISRWGKPGDVEATKLRFKPGDIIFGKRRAYQRKVAVAEFEGICSAHAMVLRAREDIVLKDFLPFFMQSDTFFERALSISVGSLSPTINWKTLAQQEFALPPKDEQRRIADILWAADDSTEAMQNALKQIEYVKNYILNDLLARGISSKSLKQSKIGMIPEHWEVKPVQEVCNAVIDCKNRTPPYSSSGHPVVRTVNIRNGHFIHDNLCFTDEISYSEWTERGKPLPGDILITREAPLGEACIIPEGMQVCLGQRVMLYRPNPNYLLNRYLLVVLLSLSTQQRLQALAGGSTVNHVRVGDIKNFIIPMPPLDEQKQIADLFSAVTANEYSIEKHLLLLKKQKKLLETSFLI